MLRHNSFEPTTAFEGVGVAQARNKALMQLLHRARPWFGPGAAAEIWGEFGPRVRDVCSPDCFEALGWVAVLLPTQTIGKRHTATGGSSTTSKKGDEVQKEEERKEREQWRGWVEDWLHLWSSVTHIHYWQSLWMNLFARLIRHDVRGVINWPALVPELTNRLMWAFQLPVGTASGGPPLEGPSPSSLALFGDFVGSRSGAAAHSLIYLMGRGSKSSAGTSGGSDGGDATTEQGDPALLALESIVALLEQYYHPSNGGKWTSSLALFLREVSGQLCRRLVIEVSRGERKIRLQLKKSLGEESHVRHQADDDEDGGDGDSDNDSDAEEGDSDDDEEDEDDEGDEDGDGGSSGGGEDFVEEEVEDDDDMDVDDDEMEGRVLTSSKGAKQEEAWPHRRRPLPQSTILRVVSALVRVASKGQASKDGHMRRYSSLVLAQLAHIHPDLVLPAVHRHFVTAMDTITAARQYGNAIQTLSLCVRPLLLAGLLSDEHEHENASGGAASIETTEITATTRKERREAAAQSVAAALMATLPGIDANDPPKSLAVFRLHCCVLSCVGQLPEDPTTAATTGSLPMYTEDYVTELLSRIFSVITNLDAPDAGSAGEHGGGGGARGTDSIDGAEFLLERSSMFRPLMELLYMRLPGQLRKSTIKRTAVFLLTNTFTSVTSEAAILCNAMAWADSTTTTDALLLPLLSALEQDISSIGVVPSVAGAGAEGDSLPPEGHHLRVSRVTETALKWRLSLLSSTTYRLGQALVPHGPRILSIIDAMMQIKSQAVQEVAARAMASVMQGLCTYYPLEQCAPFHNKTTEAVVCDESEYVSVVVEDYVDQYGNTITTTSSTPTSIPMKWHIPTSAELALASQFLTAFASIPAQKLKEYATAASTTSSTSTNTSTVSKERVRALLLQIEGALSGARSCLPDFAYNNDNDTGNGVSVSIVGALGPSPIGPSSLRAQVASALTALLRSPLVPMSDAEAVRMCLRVMDLVLCAGEAEHRDAAAGAGAWASDERWMGEPAVAGILVRHLFLSSNNASTTSTVAQKVKPLRRRRPMWIAQEKVNLSLGWRAAQAAYRSFPTTTHPQLPMEALPNEYIDLVGCAVTLMLRGVRGIREVAGSMVERVMKRIPALTPTIMAPQLCGIANVQDCLEYDVGVKVVDEGVMERLQRAAAGAAAAASSAALVESEQEQAMACGAAALLRGIACWRYVVRDWRALRALLLALTAGASHTGMEAQANLSVVMLVLILKYLRPPSEDSENVASLIVQDAMNAVVLHRSDDRENDAIAVAAKNKNNNDNENENEKKNGPALPWRYAVAVSCYPLLVLPSLGPKATPDVVSLFLTILTSDIPGPRQVGAGGLVVLFESLWRPAAPAAPGVEGGEMAAEAVEAARLRLCEALTNSSGNGSGNGSDASLLQAIFTSIASNHIALAAGSGGEGSAQQRAQFIQQFRDESVHKTLIGMLLRGDWPQGRGTITGVAKAHFLSLYARLVQTFCLVAPQVTVDGLRPCIQGALGDTPQDVDRTTTAAAAECLAGIVSSGVVFENGGWEGWVKETLRHAVTSAPLELVDLWTAALRCIVYNLGVRGRDQEVSEVLDSIIVGVESNGTGHGTGAQQYKRITYAREVLEELALLHGMHAPSPPLPAFLSTLLTDVLPSVGGGGHGEMVRQAAASLVSEVAVTLFLAPSTSSSGSLEALQGQAKEMLERLASDFDAATAVLYDHMKSGNTAGSGGSGGTAAVGDSEILAAADAAIDAVIHRGRRSLPRGELLLGDGEEAGEEDEDLDEDGVLVEMHEEENEEVEEVMDIEEASPYATAISTVAFSVEWILQLLASNTGAATPWIIRTLPSLLRLQELIPSEAQFVALVARKALIAAKYQPMYDAESVYKVLEVLEEASGGELWPERGAALSFCQYFWFRHALLLGDVGTKRVLEMVLKMLEDEKLEVRELAATTLSGVVRGLREGDAQALRQRILQRAADVFAFSSLSGGTYNKRRRRQGSASAAGTNSTNSTTAVRHGAALALQALVLSSPYDVPTWLPDILMALVPLASEPAPIKTTVTKALGEFRRTHEEGGLVEAKAALTAEQWEAIRDVASPASYFV